MSKICSTGEQNFAQLDIVPHIFCHLSWNSTHAFVSLLRIYIMIFGSIFPFLSKIWAIYAQKSSITDGLPCQREWSVALWAYANVWFMHCQLSVLQKRFLSSQTKITYPPTESREKPVNGSIKKRNKIRSPVS